MFKSWKTFSAGVAAVAGGLTGFYFSYKHGALSEATVPAYIASILTGFGLMFARDNNVSSVDVGLQGVTTNAKGEAVITPVGPTANPELTAKLPELIVQTKLTKGNL